MPAQPHAQGRRGERIAERYLRSRGARILARNVRVRHAELDLIALDRRTLCIVEVRLRTSTRYGTPAETVDARKQRHITRATAELLATTTFPRYDHIRFDVIAIDASTTPPLIHHIQDAFALTR